MIACKWCRKEIALLPSFSGEHWQTSSNEAPTYCPNGPGNDRGQQFHAPDYSIPDLTDVEAVEQWLAS